MNKQEKIKEAYGINKVVIDEDGWVKRKVTGHGQTNGMEFENFGYDRLVIDVVMQDIAGGYWWRLQVLRGINDNNGWTKIESRADLPSEEGMYLFFTVDNRSVEQYHSADISIGGVTHWRPISKIPNPLY